jgi:hypothetical protein
MKILIKHLKEVEVTHTKKHSSYVETGHRTKRNKEENKTLYLYVCTPCHSECSMHYTQALLELQQLCIKKE